MQISQCISAYREAEKAQNSLKYERRSEQMYDNRKHNYDNWNLTLSFYVVLRLLGSLIFSWKRADDLMLRFKKTNFGWSLRKTNNNPVISTPVAGDFASWWLTRTASILNWTTQHYYMGWKWWGERWPKNVWNSCRTGLKWLEPRTSKRHTYLVA